MIEKSVIENIAKLARLEINSEKVEAYSKQLSVAMEYFEQITKVKTDGVEPMVTPTEIEDFWREDVVIQNLTAEEIVQNAPDKVGNLFRVPPVI